MNFTAAQQEAITVPGNVVVSAGAGAGKTRTLVERCLRQVLAGGEGAIERVLVVTFTEAAAAEVRKRIGNELAKAAHAQPGDNRLHDEIARLDRAQISTIHSFCSRLIRENFHQLEIDPGVEILDGPRAKALFASTLDELLLEHYGEAHANSGEVLDLIRTHFRSWDELLKKVIRQIHEFTQARPNPRGWFEKQIEAFSRPDASDWEKLYADTVAEWCVKVLPYLDSLPAENGKAIECARIIREMCGRQGGTLRKLVAANCGYEKGNTVRWREPLVKVFEEAEFLASLEPTDETPHPLKDDWEWCRKPLLALLGLARQFAERYGQVKRERGVMDFNDLEQFALTLLWDPHTEKPTPLAEFWQGRFDAVFIDEYQDINEVQDRILGCVSRAGAGNRFLVGDVKQSIYAFRQARPQIFQNYFKQGSGWHSVPLQDNFRSAKPILDFLNPLFRWLMREDFGGVGYGADAELLFGNAADRTGMARRDMPAVELHLLTGREEEASDSDDDPDMGSSRAAELMKSEAEARLVAKRLAELMADENFLIFDEKEGKDRRPRWSDMVVLFRSVSANAEAYAKVFYEAGIPLHAQQEAFYSTPEVLDLCNLLYILDNPLQDIPLAAVLRSPLVGLTPSELVQVRLAAKKAPFWTALNQFNESKVDRPGKEKVERFLERCHRWRDPRVCWSLCQRLEKILADTGYDQWLLAQPRGRQRAENVRELLRIARRFDEARGESLYLFLKHIEETQEASGDVEPPAMPEENAVSLMTIHRSKGLEFPIVALSALGKSFNQQDLRSSLFLDDQFGLSSMIIPPSGGGSYPSLPLWLARARHKEAALAEEIRVLYVALTRAQNRLLLFGSASPNRAEERWSAWGQARPHPRHLLRVTCAMDWIGSYLTWQSPDWVGNRQGSAAHLEYFVHDSAPPRPERREAETQGRVFSKEEATATIQRLKHRYSHQAATLQPAKTSVTALRQATEAEIGEEALPLFRFSTEDAAARGSAMHGFMEKLDLERPLDVADLQAQGRELVAKGLLSPEEEALLNFGAVAGFWQSAIGRDVLRERAFARRELPFTVRMTAEELGRAGLAPFSGLDNTEFVVVQGVADLVVLRPEEIWLVDFKTDAVNRAPSETNVQKHRAQWTVYAQALSAIYKRPVTRGGLYFLRASEDAFQALI